MFSNLSLFWRNRYKLQFRKLFKSSSNTLKYYLYGLYPDSATIFNISVKTKCKQTNPRFLANVATSSNIAHAYCTCQNCKIIGKVKMETTCMWGLTLIILKDIKCFQIWAYFEGIGINFNFENFQNKIMRICTCTEPSSVFAHLRVQWLISQLTKILLN
jgi:hypothetical protein